MRLLLAQGPNGLAAGALSDRLGIPASTTSFHLSALENAGLISVTAYAGSKKAAEDVGFYYAANAGGRLFGILMSGLLTQYGGLTACLWGSAAMLTLCLALTLLLPTGYQARRVPVSG